MRARLIVNPQAGTDRAVEFIPLLTDRLRTLVPDLPVVISAGAEDGQRAGAAAVEDHDDAVYVVGGDGTLNSVLRGLLSREGGASIPVGIIPLGTGNDFAKGLGLGEEVEAAVDALLDPHVIDVDVGRLNGRPFVNTSAGGFIADVSDAVTETLKNTVGKLAFYVGGARALFGTEPFAARVHVHDHRGEATPAGSVDVQMFAVCNARLIGGGYPIAPDALIDDGLLDVLVVPEMPLLEFVGVLQRLAAGQPPDHASVLHFRSASFDLEVDRTIRVNTDGETLDAGRCEYRVQHRGARFFCGAQPHAAGAPIPWRA